MAQNRKFRTWNKKAERALEALVEAVELQLEAGEGEAAARDAVPAWAQENVPGLDDVDSLAALARRCGVNRSSLSVCLSGHAPHYRVRRALEHHLGLPPGGMTAVLSMVEALPVGSGE
jgi:hypothetical protein